MSKEDVVNYVMNSPYNTNKTVLTDMLDTFESETINPINEVIGDLSNLNTTDKSSVVAAINEAAQSGGSAFTVESPITYENDVIGFDGYSYTSGVIELYSGTVTTELFGAYLEGAPLLNEDQLFIECNGISYTFDAHRGEPEHLIAYYGAPYDSENEGFDFSEIPFVVTCEEYGGEYSSYFNIDSESASDGTFTLVISAPRSTVTVSDGFSAAVCAVNSENLHYVENIVDSTSSTAAVRTVGTLAEGSDYVLGAYAFAEGCRTIASGEASHSEGYETTASGSYSHAEGDVTTALGHYSHAEGFLTTASGDASHAEGSTTTASGASSHAEGYYTIANHESQHVFGKCNIADPSSNAQSALGNYVEIVGNGTSDSNRSNARTLDWSGNEALAGSLTLGLGTADEVTVTAAQLTALLALLQ